MPQRNCSNGYSSYKSKSVSDWFPRCRSHVCGLLFFMLMQLHLVTSHAGYAYEKYQKPNNSKSETPQWYPVHCEPFICMAQCKTRHDWLDSTEQIGLYWVALTNLNSEAVGSVTRSICICHWLPVTSPYDILNSSASWNWKNNINLIEENWRKHWHSRQVERPYKIIMDLNVTLITLTGVF